MGIEQEIRNEQYKQATGSAPNFRAIDGVGDKTAEKVRGVIGIDAPSDAADKTAGELAAEAGITESRAAKVIRGGGGNPNRNPRTTTGSVSAAGINVPTGDFKTEIGDKDKADARFSSSLNRGIGRSQEAARADKAKRAPVTTDFERWKNNKSGLDYPGIDTPSSEPKVLPKDFGQGQRPNTTDPESDLVETPERVSVFGGEPDDQLEAGVDNDQLYREELFGAQAEAADVSASPGELFDGVGSGGLATSVEGDVPVTDRFGRFDKDAQEEDRELRELSAQQETSPDPFEIGAGWVDDNVTPAGEAVMEFNEGNMGLRELGTEIERRASGDRR